MEAGGVGVRGGEGRHLEFVSLSQVGIPAVTSQLEAAEAIRDQIELVSWRHRGRVRARTHTHTQAMSAD